MKKLVLLFTVAFAMIFVSCTFCPTKEDREKMVSKDSTSVAIEEQNVPSMSKEEPQETPVDMQSVEPKEEVNK